ncbi:MAG: four helix bundle protein [Mediterranea sp.]|jgi:four helix bundle protein|nr:four helix bundle protein [Mediterranea sp.]
MDKKNIVIDKSYAFAIRIVNAYKFLVEEKQEYVLSKQLLRSGTAIGALLKESVHAQSRPDFLNKINIALKEANEIEYWLLLLNDTSYISQDVFQSVIADCKEIIALLVSIVKSLKETLKP